MRSFFFLFFVFGVLCGSKYYICNNTSVSPESTCQISDCCDLKEAIRKSEGENDVEFYFSTGLLNIEQAFQIKSKNLLFSGTVDTIISSNEMECLFHLLTANYESVVIENIIFSQLKSKLFCSNASSKIQNFRTEGIGIYNSVTPFVSFEIVEVVSMESVHLRENTGDVVFDFRSNNTEIFANISFVSAIDSNSNGLLNIRSQHSHVELHSDHFTVKNNNFHLSTSTPSILVDGVGTSIVMTNCHFENNQQPFLNVSSRRNEGLMLHFESNNITRNTASNGLIYLWSESGDLSSFFLNSEVSENSAKESPIVLYIIEKGYGVFSIVHEGNRFISNQRIHVRGLDGCAVRIRKMKPMEIPYIWMAHYVSFHHDFFYNNDAVSSYGAGVALTLPDRGLVTFLECLFDSNSALGDQDIGGGGAISMYGLTEILVNLVSTTFVRNKATYGGAIFCNDFAHVYFVMLNCTFEGNQAISYHKDAYSRGGAIYITRMNMRMKEAQSNFTIQISNSTFRGNKAATGGAICNVFDSQLQILAYISHTKFEKNEALSDGGAILLLDSILFIDNCEFTDNICKGTSSIGNVHNGGAMQTRASKVLITESLFSGNQAKNYGGGIFSWMDDEINIIECVFVGNSVLDQNLGVGGGLYIETHKRFYVDAMTEIRGNQAGYGGGIFVALEDGGRGEMFAKVFQNEAFVAGGGLYVWSGSPYLEMESIFGNTAKNGMNVMSMPWRFEEKKVREGSDRKNYCQFEKKFGSLYMYVCSMELLEFYDVFNQSITQETPKEFQIEIDFIGSDERDVDEWGQTRMTVDMQFEIILYDSQQVKDVKANFTIESMRRYSNMIEVEFEIYKEDDGKSGNKTVYWVLVICSATLLPVLLLACFVTLVLCCWCSNRLCCYLISLDKKKKKKSGFYRYEEL